ncbi:MAG: hypothetical protein L0L14_10705 [Tetragenococcus koreensis]|nr:hypothetical protein [Tetragenococcus koreensis]
MKDVILLRWNNLIVALGGIGYGIIMIVNPEMLNEYKNYEIIGGLFDGTFLAYAFVIMGFIKILGVILNNRSLKVLGIFGLFFLWTTFSISFFVMQFHEGFPTANGVLCAIPALISIEIALSEVS